MDPKREYIRDTWYVLRKIMKQYLYSYNKKEGLVEYDVSSMLGGTLSSEKPLNNDEGAILSDLENSGVIEIADYTGSGYPDKLKILKPKFNKSYNKYKQLCEGKETSKEEKQDTEVQADVSDKNEGKISRFPYPLPAGTKWENITIQFLSRENIKIMVKGRTHKRSYIDLGFVRGESKPNEEWTLLLALAKATAREDGELPLKELNEKKRERLAQVKKRLSEWLKGYFPIEYDPFYPASAVPSLKGKSSYKIKIKLIPPPNVGPEQEDLSEEDDTTKQVKERFKGEQEKHRDKICKNELYKDKASENDT